MTIDWWTLGFQTVNVLILIWLLGRFFFKPLSRMIAERKEAAADMLAEAETAHRKAEEALEGIAATRAGFAEEREALLRKARGEAETLRQEMLEAAKAEAETRLAAAETEIAHKAGAERAALQAEAARLAVEIAQRLLARLHGSTATEVFLDDLLKAVAALPSAERRTIAANGAHFTAVSSAPLDQQEQTRCRDRLAEILGRQPAIEFQSDPSLIAGLELKGEHLTVENSWRADLETIRRELGHERNP